MQALIVLTLSFGLLWVLFLLPQKRQVRAHQQLVAELREGDEVVLSAGIYGRITALDADEARVEVAPGVELRVARQAVLRRLDPDHGTDDQADDVVGEPLAAVESHTSDVPPSVDRDETSDPPAGDRA
jgi:preprotein translocase subunit YajC